MNSEYIIVQAGGKGSRLEHLTRNKPKALVPVNNLPMIFHLFKKFKDKKFIIIGDYLSEVLEKYLKAFAEVDYTFIDVKNKKGTCAGISEAISYIPEKKSFMLIWCDLVLPEAFEMPKEEASYIGISKDFVCRWKWKNEEFKEEASKEYGVAGLFIFENKEKLQTVPVEGEFVRWLSTQNISFTELPLYKTKEYGVLTEYNKLKTSKCRPFNKLTAEDDYIIKEGIDKQGKKLAQREIAWYKKLKDKGFANIPKIYEYEPLKMERIKGKNVFEFDLTKEEKEEVLTKIISALKSIHRFESCESNYESYYEAYIGKTFKRLEKVYDLVPFAKDEYIYINGKKCKNVFGREKELEEKFKKYFPNRFHLIHGDCTFCNTMLRESDLTPVLIDPRGYFGFTEFYGDIAYEWGKLYYSIVGNYDRFNTKNFDLYISTDSVTLSIASNGWEDMEDKFFELIGSDYTKEQIQLIHAVIWLSLTTYAWEDYDSICGSFYNGILKLREVIR